MKLIPYERGRAVSMITYFAVEIIIIMKMQTHFQPVGAAYGTAEI